MQHYIAAWKKYAVFRGRSPRAEYWTFTLVNSAIVLLLAGIGYSLAGGDASKNNIAIIIAVLFGLAIVIPTVAVTIRRLHDIGRTGWWWLIQFVPYAGPIVMIVFGCFDGQPGDNKYGQNPKGVAAVQTPPTAPQTPA